MHTDFPIGPMIGEEPTELRSAEFCLQIGIHTCWYPKARLTQKAMSVRRSHYNDEPSLVGLA